jgi:3-deoxy-7-phosphoheptulonate synthase
MLTVYVRQACVVGPAPGVELAWLIHPLTGCTRTVIIVLKANVSDEQVKHVVQRVESLGLKAHLSRGTYRTIIGVIGDETKLQSTPLEAIPGVAEVLPILPPYKLACIEAHPQPSIVDVAGVKIGGGFLGMIAGPCAVESPERMDAIAGAVRAAGANLLRGGAYKPRTSPYGFQGKGEEGLRILREVGDKHGLPIVTEVMDPRRVELVEQYADMIQIGARNMQNFTLLSEVGRTKKPVLLKRGMSATIKDLLMSAEYILSQGNANVVLCERGIKSFDNLTRNLFDVAAVPCAKALSHLPIIVDPSHAAGRPDIIPACAMAGLAAGADGVHIEVHNCPEEALSDGPQALLPEQYAELMRQLRALADLLGKTISHPAGAAILHPAGAALV